MKKNEIYTLDDGKDYIVVDAFELNNTSYVYLVEIEEKSNIIYGKLVDGGLDVITDEEELKMVLKKISEDL